MWYLDELRQITVLLGGKIRSPSNVAFGPLSRVVVDSRLVEAGDIFIALKGETYDGHVFLNEAIRKGAKAVVLSRDISRDLNVICIQVKDTLQALHMFGRFGRYRTRAHIVAVTGSVGKTTTKEMISSILNEHPTSVVASPLSFNNHVGVPLSLSRLDPHTKFGVFELGMNHPGEIHPLSAIVSPHVALITSIAEAHIGHMGSLQKVTEEKSEIFTSMSRSGTALIPADSPYTPFMLEKARANVDRVISVGQTEESDITLLDVTEDMRDMSTFVKVSILGERAHYRLPFIGKHHAINTLFALGAGLALGFRSQELTERLSSISLVKGRGSTHKIRLSGGREILLVDDAYNANPESMKAGLEGLSCFKPHFKRVIAVLGDMLELGEKEIEYHKSLAELIIRNNIDLVFTSGPLARHVFEALPPASQGRASDVPENLLGYLVDSLQHEDVLFIKGSKGSRISYIAQSLLSDNRLVA